MKMIKKVILLLFLPLGLIAQKTTKELGDFNEIKVYDGINVTLVKSSDNKAVITGKDIDQVAIVNNEGRLKIRMEIDNLLDGEDTNVTLYYKKELNLVDANEKAKIASKDVLGSKYLNVRAQEGAEIDIKINTRNLDSKAISGGKIKLSGTTINQEVLVRTGGSYYAKKLKSQRVDVTVFAGGKAFVHSNEFVEANVTAGGTIEVYGNPKTIKKDKTLGGSIIIND
ncbi:head GIN domain-containing protein [Aquimarina muelleri]|uniref:DUF2807 domain-containing protein n=1 Tax=Aquimarina muelleri TaxID=279356 RepID=A0A918JYC3_9FLAO|nr:head GIN domain-containing protein [Aquimarina muelleri]MCX2764742.1 DUF2807 domain-containing protein [Aquimarina muelleri]GGX33500.1 DUF2807 domain-containing protein [Aquimarina muelleri]